MEPHRLRAPRVDGAVLADPPLDRAGELLGNDLQKLARWDHDFQGRRAGRLRAMARTQVFARSREFLARFGLDLPEETDPRRPLIVTGHQPELFHPGVWIKNFALAALAREHGTTALNLIVDNDIPKSATIRVPRTGGGRLGAVAVDFDSWSGEVPYEDWAVSDESLFVSFGDRVRSSLSPLIPDPLIDDAWPEAVRIGRETDWIGLRFSAARRSLEQSWGVRNAEIPLSMVCETEAFGWFASHLLAHLPRFQATHNAALSRYRAAYGIRSKNHPVPLLGREGEWLEAPFWAWRAGSPRRRPLLARQASKVLELRIAGESEPLGSLRLTPDRDACCAIEDLQDLARRGIRIRTRALTTTMFARLLLGDMFLHGIGGAKYDELGDEVIRGFFAIEPPGYLTLSMTLWLGLNANPGVADEMARLERERRSLLYNPDRALSASDDAEIRRWIDAKRRAISAPVETRRERVGRFREIRRINEALAPFVTGDLARLEELRLELLEQSRQNAISMSREWSFVVHSRSRLLDAMRRNLPSAFPS